MACRNAQLSKDADVSTTAPEAMTASERIRIVSLYDKRVQTRRTRSSQTTLTLAGDEVATSVLEWYTRHPDQRRADIESTREIIVANPERVSTQRRDAALARWQSASSHERASATAGGLTAAHNSREAKAYKEYSQLSSKYEEGTLTEENLSEIVKKYKARMARRAHTKNFKSLCPPMDDLAATIQNGR